MVLTVGKWVKLVGRARCNAIGLSELRTQVYHAFVYVSGIKSLVCDIK